MAARRRRRGSCPSVHGLPLRQRLPARARRSGSGRSTRGCSGSATRPRACAAAWRSPRATCSRRGSRRPATRPRRRTTARRGSAPSSGARCSRSTGCASRCATWTSRPCARTRPAGLALRLRREPPRVEAVLREWPRIRAEIDAGHPSVVGLIRAAGVSPWTLTRNHQVLAWGWEATTGADRAPRLRPEPPGPRRRRAAGRDRRAAGRRRGGTGSPWPRPRASRCWASSASRTRRRAASAPGGLPPVAAGPLAEAGASRPPGASASGTGASHSSRRPPQR